MQFQNSICPNLIQAKATAVAAAHNVYMAALVCIAYSVGVHFYRAGCVFIRSGGSIQECWQYLSDQRIELLNQRYLEQLDRIYPKNSLGAASSKKSTCCERRNFVMEEANSLCSSLSFAEEADEDFEDLSEAVSSPFCNCYVKPLIRFGAIPVQSLFIICLVVDVSVFFVECHVRYVRCVSAVIRRGGWIRVYSY